MITTKRVSSLKKGRYGSWSVRHEGSCPCKKHQPKHRKTEQDFRVSGPFRHSGTGKQADEKGDPAALRA